jgi:outer membrane protein OmpA-like peptidoglycan-associated protein
MKQSSSHRLATKRLGSHRLGSLRLGSLRLGAKRIAQLLLAAGALSLAPSCTQVSAMRGEIEGLRKVSDQAERNGAIRCAPRELALAKSHLQFAEIELDQGFFPRAKDHLQIAMSNAHAAYDLSPPEKCAERGFVEEAPKVGDRDGDGILDDVDKCPDEPENYNGYQDNDGCPDDPDTDGDGIPDSRDQCVLEPEDKDGYLDDDGCPDVDNDLDTVPDVKDKDPVTGRSCANDPEDPDGYEDEDGCPEPDNDKDGVLDVDDQCPNEPGPVDNKGCPKKPSLVVVTDKEIKILQQIHFEFDKDKIRPESFKILDAVADVLKRFPRIKIEIQGHTDNKGRPDYNKKLSDRRAAAVLKYLVSHGVEAGRLVSHGYGMERPLVANDTDQGRALNRRVQFIRTEGQP